MVSMKDDDALIAELAGLLEVEEEAIRASLDRGERVAGGELRNMVGPLDELSDRELGAVLSSVYKRGFEDAIEVVRKLMEDR